MGADLNGVTSGGVIVNSNTVLPWPYMARKGYLIGPDVDLSDADLTGVDLTGAFLSRVDLTNAILAGVKWVNPDHPRRPPASLPENYKLIKGYLVGPGADLSDADLTGDTLHHPPPTHRGGG